MKLSLDISFEENSDIIYKDEVCLIHSFCGSFNFNINKESNEPLFKLFREAQLKYSRMHYGDPSIRFEKSWTGYIGELCVIETLKKKLNLTVNETEIIIDENGYDGGDIHFIRNSKKYTVNVSSRKLSSKDEILNVITKPYQYFILIPIDQIDQYINRSDLAFFNFIKYNNDSLIEKEIEGVSVKIHTSGKFIIPGFLMSSDISYLKNSGFLQKVSKGMILKGLYGDMNYSVPMYTNNYVLFSSHLRKFQKISTQYKNHKQIK
jgi:hypothetical protein